MSNTKNTEEPIDLTEEDDEFEIGDEEDEGFNPLEDLLVTDDGENIANALKNSIDRVGKHLENQNKILIKIFGVLNKSGPN
jgi:hypothetical protein